MTKTTKTFPSSKLFTIFFQERQLPSMLLLRTTTGSVNSIMSSITCPQEDVQMQLLYSNCVPKLTYGAAVKELTAAEKQQYSVALNNAVRRIFGFRRWESIRYIREFYKYDSIEMLFAKARTRFERSLTSHSNHVLRFLSRFIPSSVDVN